LRAVDRIKERVSDIWRLLWLAFARVPAYEPPAFRYKIAHRFRQRDIAIGERDEILRQRDIAIGECNEFLCQRDIALGDRNEFLRQRDSGA
jgi:hypothetical protein